MGEGEKIMGEIEYGERLVDHVRRVSMRSGGRCI
jgi:hypothetical protein